MDPRRHPAPRDNHRNSRNLSRPPAVIEGLEERTLLSALLEGQDPLTVTVAGDANIDLKVDRTDLAILIQNWGATGATWEQGDFDGDGIVSLVDLRQVAKNFGYDATAEPPNQAPVFGGVPDIMLIQGDTLNNQTDLWAFAEDTETPDQELTFTIINDTNPSAGVTLDQNRWFDINPLVSFTGSTNITVEVSDGVNTATDTFTVFVMANHAPIFGNVPDITLDQGTTLNNETDLWAFAQDAEKPDHELIFTIVNDTNPAAGVTLDQNRWFDINPPANFTGSTDITVQVFDGVNTVTDTFTVTVVSTDQAPVFGGVPDIALPQGTTLNNETDLWAFAQDAEKPDHELIFTIINDTNPAAGVTLDQNRWFDIRPPADFVGSTDITVQVSDGVNTATDTFTVFVTLSQAPVFGGVPDITLDQGTALNNETDLWAFAQDPETPDHELFFTIINDTNPAAGVTLDQNRWFDINPPATFSGSTDITVQVSDGVNTATDTFTVTVVPDGVPGPVNQAPVFGGVPDITLAQGTTLNNETDLWAFAQDAETPDHELFFTIINDTNPAAGVTLDQNRWFDINPPASFSGSTDITVQVSDGVNTATDTFTVTVEPNEEPEPVNQAPVFGGLPNITLPQGTTLNNQTDLWAFAQDAETPDDQLVFTIIGNTNPAVGVTLDQNRWIDVDPSSSFSGSTNITVQVSDGANTASDTFTVTVEPEEVPDPVNQAPVFGGLPDITLDQGTALNNQTDLWAFAQDAETPDHELAFTIIGNTNPAAGVTLDQNRWFDINPAASFTGSTDVTVQVSDGVNTATDTFTVTVTPVETPEPPLPPDPSDTSGPTNPLYLDLDGDGYGVAAPNGPDADDSDPNVNTVATMLAEYGSFENYLLQVKGHDANRIFYISASGNDSTAEVGNPNKPFRTWGAIRGNESNPLQPGDVVVWRGGTYTEKVTTKKIGSRDFVIQGTAADPILLMAYPGEAVRLNGADCIELGGTMGAGPNHIVLDGFILDNTVSPGTGRGLFIEGAYQGKVQNVTIRNLEIMRHFWGFLANVNLHDMLIEGSVIHDNTGEHGIYWGSNNGIVNTNLTVRGNLIYDNAMQGFYHNGPVTNLLVEDNIIHSNGTVGIEFINGVCNSIVRNNLVFNNAKQAVVLYNYSSTSASILPFDQTNNLFVNNTFWVGQYSKPGRVSPGSYAAVLFNESANGYFSFDNNIFRNNIIVTSSGPAFRFQQADYADTTVIENNVIYSMNGAPVMQYAGTNYSASQFESFSSLIRNNRFTDPGFRDVSVNYYAQPERFDFSLLSNSPAIDLGSWSGAPDVDLIGDARVGLPDAGAYEY